ncbi:hypothetical protein INN71_01720 [Nocardioides sp. ChNu-153]|uniref:hypothetical protein n=1 Tax=unclassified Nocardioides TaxID=2615069 RepID=UPI0024076D41|nr:MULTISPECIES: hypothetical protein [unclassified Nocardioides]MDF9714770.1 hypothetical protein [Nocardioides sp. ChNu-99]MDN7120104.1 hypothetical protein [Nocardioides sp. ChNu-153]
MTTRRRGWVRRVVPLAALATGVGVFALAAGYLFIDRDGPPTDHGARLACEAALQETTEDELRFDVPESVHRDGDAATVDGSFGLQGQPDDVGNGSYTCAARWTGGETAPWEVDQLSTLTVNRSGFDVPAP